MKTLVIAVAAVALLATTDQAEAGIVCPQADGSVSTMPDHGECKTKLELERERADQDAAPRRRQSERESADFVQASGFCTQQVNRKKYYSIPDFKTVTRGDGTVRMLGTVTERFEYQICMEQQGHPLTSK